MPARTVRPQIGGQDRVQRRGRDPQIGQTARALRHHVVARQVAHLVAGQNAVGEQPEGDGLRNVQHPAHDLCHRERHVHDDPLAPDFGQHAPHQVAERGHFRPAQFIDARRHVAQQRRFRGGGHIVDIDRLEARLRAHHGQEGRKPRHARETVEELILGPENDRRAQDDRAGEMAGDQRLALGLGALIQAVGPRIGPDGRQVDQTRHAQFRRNAGHAPRPFGLHRVKAVAPDGVQDAHAIDHRIGPLHDGAHRRIVADVAQDRFHLAHDTVRFDMQRFVGAAHGHAHAPARLCHAPGNIAPDKTRAAVDGDKLRHRALRNAGQGECIPWDA